MKKFLLLGLMVFASTTAIFAQAKPGQILRHVVLFKFKDNATAANVKSVEDAFLLLPSQINLIKGFEYGTNNSPEKLNEGLTHCFFVSFTTENDRDDYLVHPAHKAFVEILQPFLDKVVVVDYWARQ